MSVVALLTRGRAQRRRSRASTQVIEVCGGPFDGAQLEVPRRTAPGLRIVLSSHDGLAAQYELVHREGCLEARHFGLGAGCGVVPSPVCAYGVESADVAQR